MEIIPSNEEPSCPVISAFAARLALIHTAADFLRASGEDGSGAREPSSPVPPTNPGSMALELTEPTYILESEEGSRLMLAK